MDEKVFKKHDGENKVWTYVNYINVCRKVAVIAVAKTKLEAAVLINQSLKEDGLPEEATVDNVHLFPTHDPKVYILHNGDY